LKDYKQYYAFAALKVGDGIDATYKADKGRWYPATYKGEDPEGREYYLGVEYDDTPNKIFGVHQKDVSLSEYGGYYLTKSISGRSVAIERALPSAHLEDLFEKLTAEQEARGSA